jgi:isoquinoline 1-oxidoreductase beta subunit
MKKISRRRFLQSSAALAGGLVISFWLPGGGGRLASAQAPKPPAVPPNAFLRIGKDGSVTVMIKHLEFGQGVTTSLPMILCEELECDWTKVRYELAPAAPEYAHTGFGMQMTGGSSSVWNSFDQLRTVGAQARTMLIQAAAEQWKVKPAEVRAEKGMLIGPGSRRMPFGQVAEAAGNSLFRKVAQGPQGLQADQAAHAPHRFRRKSRGKAKFGSTSEAQGPPPRWCCIPPVFGARVKSFNARQGEGGHPGVTAGPSSKSGVAVVATNFWAAKKARCARGRMGPPGPAKLAVDARMFAALRRPLKTPGKVATRPREGLRSKARRDDRAEYEVRTSRRQWSPSIAPSSAGWRGALGRLAIPRRVDQAAAARWGSEPEQVKVNTLLAGGGFGRRANPGSDYGIEACEIA